MEEPVRHFVESTGVLSDAAGLRERAERDGYLFFRGLVDPNDVRAVRQGFVDIIARHGWLDAGTEPDELISTQPARIEGMEEFGPVLLAFQSMESFHALAHSPGIVDALGLLFGESVLVHPRNIGRIMFSTTPTTPPHQDYVHIQGTPDVWTAWVPLGAVPVELGGLAVLAGTHREGVYPVQRMTGAGGIGVVTDALEAEHEWVTNDFETGDVLLFHSQTIHRSLPNTTGNRMRLSVDYRYQGVSQPVTEGSLLPHFNRFGWDTVYQGWTSTQYQYYWREMPLNVVPFERGAVRLREEGAKEPVRPGY